MPTKFMRHASVIAATGLALASASIQPAIAQNSDPRIVAFESQLEDFRRSAAIPSLSILVVEDGEIISESYLGWADDEGDVATSDRTSYYIASVTKPISGTTLFLADLAGDISLDAPLERSADWVDFCEWFPQSPIPFAGGRIDDLEIPAFDCAGSSMRDILDMRVNGRAGTAFLYNPVVFSRLGRVIDETSPVGFRDLMYAHVLNPAGMEDTAAGWRDSERGHVLSNLAPPFAVEGENFVKQIMPDDDFRAAAGLYMTARDLARFDRALDSGVLMNEQSRAEMWSPPINETGQASVYANGWFVQPWRGERLIWHSGWQPRAYSALYLKVPDRDITLIALANSEGLWWGNRLDEASVETAPIAQLFFEAFEIGEFQ